MPILSQIPFLKNIYQNQKNILYKIKQEKNEDENSNNTKESFLFDESFRELYTAIRFLSKGSDMKTITITSSIEEEGKSIISLMLAKTLEDFNQKVLIIDGDMRSPSIHSIMDNDNLIGFSNLLSDNSLNVKDVIRTNEKKHLGFEFITAGQVSFNPSKLIDSEKFKEVLNDIKDLKKYDYLIFDTPPILGITDTSFLSRCCDLTLFIVSLDCVDKRLAFKSLMKMKRSNSQILGVIANSVKPEYEIDLTRFGFDKYSFGKIPYTYNYSKKAGDSKLISVLESEEDINKDKKLHFIGRFLKIFFQWIDKT